MENKIKVIITGSTGMVGEGVLHVCLKNPNVESILVINRKSSGYTHPKLKEIIHADFFNLTPIAKGLEGYDACFFCLGISSIGVSKELYYQMTYTLTMHVAQTLSTLNPKMTFCYISGAGTNGSEKGGMNWAKVKGKTENDLTKLPFKKVFNFRPGMIKPIPGMKHTHSGYKFLGWLFPILKVINERSFVTLEELGLAMINSVSQHRERAVVEVKDIKTMAKML